MSLYDDIEAPKPGIWQSAGAINLLQSQLQLKKAGVTQVKRDHLRKNIPNLPPSLEDLKPKIKEEEIPTISLTSFGQVPTLSLSSAFRASAIQLYGADVDWNVDDEYDPLRPNDYNKLSRDKRDKRRQDDDEEKGKRKESRFEPEAPTAASNSGSTGFSRRPSDDDDGEQDMKRAVAGGAAIAPPPSLQVESRPKMIPQSPNIPGGGLAFAAKIMAKFGYKEGQGLGRQQQGISSALTVEKTSKRGGRIVSEKEIMPPPPFPASAPKPELTITEMMKNPAKTVLLRNMVGPGEVDQDLEPEVKEECNTKYGDVANVNIVELSNVPDDEAVRILVEFKRIESAIKAVVDLNGRFFGGRQVKANFQH